MCSRYDRHMLLVILLCSATREFYTLSLHDALPICGFSTDALREIRSSSKHIETTDLDRFVSLWQENYERASELGRKDRKSTRSELQSQSNIVCRLLLEKKKIIDILYQSVIDL